MTSSSATDLCIVEYNQVVEFMGDKVEMPLTDDLGYLFNLYINHNVLGGSKNTLRAKKHDINSFNKFYEYFMGTLNKMYWVPSTSRAYQKYLQEEKKLKPTTINRKIATLRHAASWMFKQSYLQFEPFDGVKDIEMTAIGWKGLSQKEIMRLKAACDARMAICKRKDQNPLLDTAIFYILLCTGLREMELCNLNYNQYDGMSFKNVKRKGNKVSGLVKLHIEAKQLLDRYLSTRQNIEPNDPLFLNKRGKRLRTRDVSYACTQIRLQANAKLPLFEHVVFTPHSLRHAFLKKVADKYGIHTALELSGNVSMKEIYRYTRPSVEEMQNIVNECFE